MIVIYFVTATGERSVNKVILGTENPYFMYVCSVCSLLLIFSVIIIIRFSIGIAIASLFLLLYDLIVNN